MDCGDEAAERGEEVSSSLTLKIEVPIDLSVLCSEQTTITLKSQDFKNALYEVCCNEHSSCNDACPVYRENGSKVPIDKAWQSECFCFKDGGAMLKFLRDKRQKGKAS